MVRRLLQWTRAPMRFRKAKRKPPNHFFWDVQDQITADYRGVPTYACPCGCNMFFMLAAFDTDTALPGYYVLDGLCMRCHSLVTLPCPTDYMTEEYR